MSKYYPFLYTNICFNPFAKADPQSPSLIYRAYQALAGKEENIFLSLFYIEMLRDTFFQKGIRSEKRNGVFDYIIFMVPLLLKLLSDLFSYLQLKITDCLKLKRNLHYPIYYPHYSPRSHNLLTWTMIMLLKLICSLLYIPKVVYVFVERLKHFVALLFSVIILPVLYVGDKILDGHKTIDHSLKNNDAEMNAPSM